MADLITSEFVSQACSPIIASCSKKMYFKNSDIGSCFGHMNYLAYLCIMSFPQFLLKPHLLPAMNVIVAVISAMDPLYNGMYGEMNE